MSLDLRELYQETILDHHRRPRNRGRVAEAEHQAVGHNPLCGDHVEISLRTEGGRITEVAFEGEGCAISTASASMMTEVIKGKTLAEVEQTFRDFQAMVTSTSDEAPAEGLGDLEVLAGVREHPVRIKCATLAWHTLHAALQGTQKASTE